MNGSKPPSWSDDQWRRLGTMLVDERSASEIAAAVGKSRNTVLGAIHRAGGTAALRKAFCGGVPTQDPAGRAGTKTRTGGRGVDWSEAELATARQMRAAGRTYPAIATALGRPLASVKGKAAATNGFGVPAAAAGGRERAKALAPPRAEATAAVPAVSIWSGWSRAEKAAAVAAGIAAGQDNVEMGAAWGTTPASIGSFRRDAEGAIAALLPVPLRGRVALRKRHDLFLTETRSDRPQPAEPVTREWTPPEDGGVRFLDRRDRQCARLLPREGRSILEAMVCGRPVVGESSWCAACLPVLTRPQTVAERKEARKVERAA